MFKEMWYVIALCFIAVHAQNNTDAKATATASDQKTGKVEATNISALYIGDLLRTKPKDVLETSASFHQPVVLDRGYLHSASVPHYKSHGGHESEEVGHVQPQGKANAPSAVKRIGSQPRAVPVNVMGHLLTLKPVRVVSADSLPASRSKGYAAKDDCSKSGDHSYSSEESPYVPEQPTYRRAKQVAPNPDSDYRSPPRSYDEDDRESTYSQSDPSSASYDSKSYPVDTNTKSHSSGTYSNSKSTSTSKSIIPTRSTQRPEAVLELEDYEKRFNSGGPSSGDREVKVYKTKKPANQRPSSYSDSAERDYPPSSYEREYKSDVRESSPYSQQPSGGRKSKYSHGGRTQYSTSEPKEKPQHYAPSAYEQDKPTYEPSTYSPPGEQRYRDQKKPTSNYHQEEYAQRPDTRGQEQPKPYYQNYQAPDSTTAYENTPPSKPQLRKKHRKTHYETPSSDTRDQHSGYRSRDPSLNKEYNSYPHDHQLQSSRPRKQSPQYSEPYPPQESHTESAPSAETYERHHPALRPSEDKQMHQYTYEATPEQPGTSHGKHQSSHKRHYRESSRSARSPVKHLKPVVMEGRANLPGQANGPMIMVSRESKPYASHFGSHSRKNYNLDLNPTFNFKELEAFRENGGRPTNNKDYQTSYKPYNSEYPASYANDQHHNAEEQHLSQSYEPPQHQSYAGPSHSQTQSYSEAGGPAPEQPYNEDYEEDDEGGSYGQSGGGPAKKDKTHHYISKIEGYKDSYAPNEPLTIDEAFFKKYGISPTAKVIVANAQKPNLFVADGTGIKEGEYFGISTHNSRPDHGHGHGHGPDHGHGHGHSEEDSYEPDYKGGYKNGDSSYEEEPDFDSSSRKKIPGSFDDLVDTNPKFLRNLPEIMKGEDSIFKMDSSDTSFDDVEFPREKKGYVVSQGQGELVQQHGDGVSRIIFNVPKEESVAESSSIVRKMLKDESADRMLEAAASEAIASILKSDS